VFSQPSVHSSFNISYTGINSRLGGEYFFSNHFSAGIGVKLLSFRPVTDNQGHVFRDRLKPNNFKEKMGFYTTFNYYPFKKHNYLNPFIGYDFNFTKSSKQVHFYNFKGYLENQETGELIEIFQLVETHLTNPMISLENTLQIGLDITIFKGLKLTQKVGGGAQHVYKVPIEYGPLDGFANFIWTYQIGLLYDFGDVIKNKKK